MTQLRFMDIRIVFEKEVDEFDPEFSRFVPVKAYQLAANIDHDDLYEVAEMWAQSDHCHLLPDDVIVGALSNEETDLR